MCPRDPTLRRHFKAHRGAITGLAFSPSGKQLASSSDDESIMIWNMSSITTSLRYIARKLPVNYVSFSPNGDLMGSCQGPYIRLWVPSVRGKSTEFRAHTSTCLCVNFSPDGNQIITSGADKNIKLWTTARRKFVASLPGHNNWVRVVKFSPDGSAVVSCSDDKMVKLWDPKSGKMIHTFFEKRGIPKCVDFHPFGSYVGVALSHSVVKLYDLRERRLLQYYSCHSDSANAVAFHPNGHFLLTGSDDSTNKVIDLVEGRAIYTLQGHKGPVTAVAFNETGDHFATGSADKQVLVWETNLVPRCSGEALKPEIQKSFDNNNCCKTTQVSAKSSSNDFRIPYDDSDVQEVYCAKNYQEDEESNSDEGVPSSSVSEHPPRRYPGTYPPPEVVDLEEEINSVLSARRSKMCPQQMEEALDNLSKENEELRKILAVMEKKVTSLEEIVKQRGNSKE